ncbi:MAG: acyl carrier protein [Pseudonocardiaceae bacterium]
MLALSAVPTVVRNEIRALLSESGDEIDHLADDDQLHDLGLNSLLLARLIIQLEIRLEVDPFSEDVTISDARSVGALVGAYQRALARADQKDGSGERSHAA